MRWWPRKTHGAKEANQVIGPPPAKSPQEDEREYLTRLAGSQLSPEMAQRWQALLRPAIRLLAAEPGQLVVARLGGRPLVPEEFVWPAWTGHGPLTFVGEVDVDAVDQSDLDPGIELPKTGRLLAFYFDGSFDNFEGIVGTWDRESLAGARLLHVQASRAECIQRATPDGVIEFKPQDLTGHQVMTFPNWEHPVLRREFGLPDQDHREWMDHPINAEPFTGALWALHADGPRHQIGGWADPEQGPVEFEVAQAVLDEPFEYGDARHTDEALRWSLLLQVASDDASDMMWGDVGALYWMTRVTPTEPTDLGRVSFTWQCG